MMRSDYDRWRCIVCGCERLLPSVPILHPACCGTGMWWTQFMEGPPYVYNPPEDWG